MAWENYLRAGHQVPYISEELMQSQHSAILNQNNQVSENGVSSVMNPISLSNSVNQMQLHNQLTYQNAQFVSGDMNIQAYSNSHPSGFTFDGSSLITDGNSSISVSSYLNSVNINSAEGSPGSNCAISGFSAGNPFPAQNQNSQENQNGLRLCKRQGESLSNPHSTSRVVRSIYQTPVPPMVHIKRPRLEGQEGSSSMQLRIYEPEQAPSLFMQPNSLPTNQQQRIQINSVPNSQQLPVEFQNLAVQHGVHVHRLMCYIKQQRRRPSDNNIGFWKKFVEEFYCPGAKRRWCLSKYENVGRQALSVFPPSSMGSWTCDLCTTKSAKGFVATFEFLPRLKKAFFESDVTDEILYVDYPSERRLSSGYMVLWFSKAVQQTIYKDFRVVHEGQLRIVFTPKLKIISWEFCVQRHEEIIPRRLVAPEMKAMVKSAVKCHLDFETIGNEEVARQALLSNCNRVQAAGQELAKKLELPIVNELGFPKTFVRCFQVTEVFDCMKDLMSYSLQTNLSPTESLRRYPGDVSNAVQMKAMELQAQMRNAQIPPPGFRVPNNNYVLETSDPHQKLPMKQPIIDQPNFVLSNPQQAPYLPSSSSNPIPCGSHNYLAGPSQKQLAGPSFYSSSSQQDIMLNDLLSIMPDEGAFDSWLYGTKDPKGKSRIISDPNVVKPEDNGKEVNASSGSNVHPEVKVVKREPNSEKDFA